MNAIDFIDDYEKITDRDKTATFFHANTMFEFAEDYHQAQLKLLGISSVGVTLVCDIEKGTKCNKQDIKYRTGVCRNCGGQAD